MQEAYDFVVLSFLSARTSAMPKKILIFLNALAVTFAAQAFAADDDPNIYLIKARQGDMALRGYSVAPLFGMAKGKIPYDAEVAKKLANNLKVLLELDIGGAWAAGTGKDKYPGKTHALPEIWSTYPKVAEAGKKYQAAVNEFVAVAGEGLEAMRSKIGDLGDSCKGCHDDFREKE
jgi:cytochrome c556